MEKLRLSPPPEEPKQLIIIPDRTSSKRPRNLEDERDELNKELERERKKLKPRGSFDAEFWSRAAEIENITLKRTEIQKKISLRDFNAEREHSEGTEWEETEKARDLFEQIRAQQTTAKIYQEQAEKLSGTKRSFRASFMKLFTTSKMGLGILTTGSGERGSKEQTKFRENLIEAYDSSYPGLEDWLWCPITGDWVERGIAGHLFAYMHGQDTMDAIFGKTQKPELFSPKNGLIISERIEKVFDSGFLVIVPQLPERPTKLQIAEWLAQKPRQYMTRVIDPSSKLMEQRISLAHTMQFKDLDNRPLKFRNDFRPAARYLYFHYCLQVLRRAWKQPVKESKHTLNDEIGKKYWGTPGRYLPRNMLLAFVEELGHEYDGLLKGASCSKGEEPMALLAAASRQVKRRAPLNLGMYSESEGEDDEDEDDGDGEDETVV